MEERWRMRRMEWKYTDLHGGCCVWNLLGFGILGLGVVGKALLWRFGCRMDGYNGLWLN
ncbi:hypothetical protein IMZ48_47995 [Candidatus Bathyarchaeota archaeon]|nr:hypothetical protein [Candidatus Bathyarchaeota archaeon]